MKAIFILITFFLLINDSFEFENMRKLEDNYELNDTDIRIYNNSLIIECNDFHSLNLTNDTDVILNFNNYDNSENLSCNFFAYDRDINNVSEFYKIECPFDESIKSNFSKSQLYLPKQNKTLDIVMFDKSVNYNYNLLKFLTFADFKTNNGISTLKAFFPKPSNYTTKKNLFFGVKLKYNNSTDDWVIAEGIEMNKKINGTLIYNVTIKHENKSIVDINSNNNYCLTDNESQAITYCDGAKGTKTDMKVEYQIITFYNSKILNPNDKNIKIQGDLSDKINLASNSNNFHLTDTLGNNLNCSLAVNDTKYNMNCNLGRLTYSNLLYATANITNIIANESNLRILEEGKGILALINGEENDLEADYIATPIKTRNNSSGGLSGGAIAGIVIACVAAIAAGITTAICLSRKPPSPQKHVGVSNSTDNINQN